MGMGYSILKDVGSAGKAFERAAESGNPVAQWLHGGYHLHVAEEAELAKKSWRQTLNVLEANTEEALRARLLRDLGEVSTLRGETEEAIASLNDALAAAAKCDPEHWLIGSTLCQLARAFHAQDNAVTAEGYFRSAMSRLESPTAPISELPYSIWEYSRLLRQWEKREADAKQLKERATGLIEALPMEAGCSRFVVPFVHEEEARAQWDGLH